MRVAPHIEYIVGLGLLDYMVKKQVTDSGEEYPPFGIYGGTYEGATQDYKNFRTDDTEDDAIYIIKANAPIDSAMYSYVQSQLESGKIKFLIEQRIAKNKLLGKQMGKNMSPQQREEYLLPFTLTDILKTEMLNLREESEGINIRLKPATRTIGHDKFSSLGYGIYYIREVEDIRNKRKRRKFSEMIFMN